MKTKYAIRLTEKVIMVTMTERAPAFVTLHKSRVYRMSTERLATLWDTREGAESFLTKVSRSSGPAVVEVQA
jgi:hypothetical protein